jgi:hypothetical protein
VSDPSSMYVGGTVSSLIRHVLEIRLIATPLNLQGKHKPSDHIPFVANVIQTSTSTSKLYAGSTTFTPTRQKGSRRQAKFLALRQQ